MTSPAINLLAVLVATVASMIIGAAWYGILGAPWLKAIGKTKEQLGNPMSGYVISALTAFVTAYVMAHFVAYAGAADLATGAQTGFWVWLGFIATFTAMTTAWEGKSWNLWLLNNGHQLLALVAMGMILASWR